MNYLDKILEAKRAELAVTATAAAQAELLRMAADAPAPVPFAQSIRGRNGIIAEFKRRSPSKGVIHEGLTPKDVVPFYQEAGVSAISCLTNTEFFGGSLSDLHEAVASVSIPVLRKEFILSEFQIVEARAHGASAVLLIAAALTVDEMRHLAATAQQLGMEVLLELHDEDELGYVCPGVTVAGINNRNLRTFKVDLEHSIRVSHLLPDNMPRVSESGISAVEDMVRLRKEGFDGFLIGENFMRADNPGQACIDFCRQYANLVNA